MKVSTEKSKERIGAMFDSIAHSYDRLNHSLSLGIDRLWRRRVTRMAERMKAHHVLDIATGTGDMAIALARLACTEKITGGDFSDNMLAIARQKASRLRYCDKIEFRREDALGLSMPDDSFDLVTVAFGARNFADLEKGLSEMHRVTRNGGSVAVLELTIPANPVVKAFYRLYLHGILPIVGRIASKDRSAYEYLPASVEQFPQRERFTEIMARTGWRNCRYESLTFGIATMYTAEK